jgi:hypothetical protein
MRWSPSKHPRDSDGKFRRTSARRQRKIDRITRLHARTQANIAAGYPNLQPGTDTRRTVDAIQRRREIVLANLTAAQASQTAARSTGRMSTRAARRSAKSTR